MRSPVAGLAGAAALSLIFGFMIAAPAGAATASRLPSVGGPAIVTGTAHAVARSVSVSSLSRVKAGIAAGQARGPLGRDGRLAGAALPVRHSSGARPAATPQTRKADQAAVAAGANTRPAAGPDARVGGTGTRFSSSSMVTRATSSSPSDFRGITEGSSDCTSCLTPDASAAVNGSELAEAANSVLQVYSKSTAATLCSVSLASLLGAVSGLSHPRIQYDNASKRFSLVADSVPGSAYDVPVQYLAVSQADDACGAWWVYSIVFSGNSMYPLGATLDYPSLGQDNTSILSSTNNYAYGGSYLGSSAYAMSKSAAYSGAGFNVTTYSVAFSTQPVTVAGIPTFSTTKTYWLAAVPGTGYDLYSMPTSPAGAITLKAVINAPFSAPSRQVIQPGTSQTLNPLDGRIQSSPVQDGSYVWFANDVNDGGYPTVLYGAIDVATNQAETAYAYHGSGSDDFNPSIAVTDAGDNTNYIWLNWAYTDPPAGEPVSAAAAGIAPGDGVPTEAGVDLTLVTGSSTSAISTFGGYSSAEIDPSGTSGCPAGLTALTAQEYFTSTGTWTTQLARTTFC